jgi:hypothetical protein
VDVVPATGLAWVYACLGCPRAQHKTRSNHHVLAM